MLESQRIYRRYSEVRRLILSADLLLYRSRWRWLHPLKSIVHVLIRLQGRSECIHASAAIWARKRLMVGETNGGVGARVVSLSSQVAACPGLIDLYRANPNDLPGYDREVSADVMFCAAGRPYGWNSIFRTALTYIGFRADTDDSGHDRQREPYCSASKSRADRIAGHDPVLNLADSETTPGDLARSDFYRYFCTLIPG